MPQTFNADALRRADAQTILHPASMTADIAANGPQGVIVGGEGCVVADVDGARLLDAVGGLWCVNAGYGRGEIGEAMKAAASALGYFHTFSGMSNPQQIELAERLMKIAPPNMGRVFFGCSGSDCNDALMKIVWLTNFIRGKPRKRKIICRRQGYHGTTVAAASLSGLESFHTGFGLPLPEIAHVSCPHPYRFAKEGESEQAYSARLAAELDETIRREGGADAVAAFFAEPIMGAGGVIVPPKGYFEAVQPVLKDHDVLLAVDEVVCGYGRLGTWFGHNHPDLPIEPDMVATAKGLTSGYFPLSAGFISKEIHETLVEGSKTLGVFAHGFTYAGHPVGCAAANVNLTILEREALIGRAAEQGRYLHERLNATIGGHDNVGEIRGVGLLAGVQLVESKAERRMFDPSLKTAARVAAAARRRGVIVRPLPSADSIAMSPPLVIAREDVDVLADALSGALEEVFP